MRSAPPGLEEKEEGWRSGSSIAMGYTIVAIQHLF
jgi:hypothetical protein